VDMDNDVSKSEPTSYISFNFHVCSFFAISFSEGGV